MLYFLRSLANRSQHFAQSSSFINKYEYRTPTKKPVESYMQNGGARDQNYNTLKRIKKPKAASGMHLNVTSCMAK